jgi:mannose-1-phosphate guanylyltransferase/mannose-6-phosphate isomerase
MKEVRVIGEPVGRNTAPAVALGAALARREDPGAVVGVFPSDHRVGDEDGFLRVLSGAIDLAAEGEYLVTVGVRPTRAETGYGYISRGEALGTADGAYRVGRFTEKPDLKLAHQFLNSGVHLWNSGMFVWKASTILESISEHLPDLFSQLDLFLRRCESDFEAALMDFYQAAPSTSIDYGVMEKADNVAVIEARFEWDDLGAWDCMERLHKTDARGNAVVGDAELIDTRNCTLVSENGVIGAVGVEDLIIVHTPEATLVCRKENAQQVRRIVQAIERKARGADQ